MGGISILARLKLTKLQKSHKEFNWHKLGSRGLRLKQSIMEFENLHSIFEVMQRNTLQCTSHIIMFKLLLDVGGVGRARYPTWSEQSEQEHWDSEYTHIILIHTYVWSSIPLLQYYKCYTRLTMRVTQLHTLHRKWHWTTRWSRFIKCRSVPQI